MFVSGSRQGACGRGLIFLISLAAAYSVKADLCHPLTLGSHAGLESSEWSEFSDSGARLVRETGNLRSTGLGAGMRCSDLEFGLDWSRSWGQRHYAGVTNRQKSVETVSDIDTHTLSGDALYWLNSSWAVGLKAQQRTTRRSIRTTPEAVGYPERFESVTFFSGAKYRKAINDDVVFTAEGWTGKGDSGTVWLYLPNTEPAELALGSSRLAQVGITLAKNDVPSDGRGWRWSAGLNYSTIVTKAGPRTALFRAGRVVATANQPKTETKTVGLLANLAYYF